MIIRYFVTAKLEWFVTGYPNDYCNISNHEFPVLIPEVGEAQRVADLANAQNPDMTFETATIVMSGLNLMKKSGNEEEQ